MSLSRFIFASALAFLVTAPIRAAINITTMPSPDPFPAVPNVAEWSTLQVGPAAVSITPEAFDEKVIAMIDAELVGTGLGISATIPPSTNGLARWNTGANSGGITFLQTRPAGVDYLVLMAHLQNTTGAPVNALAIAYEYSAAGFVATEEIRGLRAYWSFSGSPGTWTMIPALSVATTATFDAPEVLTATITLPAPLAHSGLMYLLWADQNSTGTDASYHIRNFSATAGINCAISGAASNIQRNAGGNAADPLDDTMTFTATFTGTGEVSPSGWKVISPASLAGVTGAYGIPHTFSNLPVSAFGAGSVLLTVADADSALCQTSVNVTIPRMDAIGRVNVGGGLATLFSDTSVPSPPEWVNDPASLTLTMNGGGAAQAVVTSQTLDLSAVGEVRFTANFRIQDTSAGTNFESADRFKAELIIDGITHNLISMWDIGSGSGSTTDPGVNGAPDGFLNGYTGSIGVDFVTGAVYATTGEDYNANRMRDEFNLEGQPVEDILDNDFPLSFTIPANANSVKFIITGSGAAGSEIFTVSGVLFESDDGDIDGDGVSDVDEDIMGTNPGNPADVLNLTRHPEISGLVGFPSKPGRFYRVYTSVDLQSWTVSRLPAIAGDGSVKQFDTSTIAPARRFYRLQVMLADGPWPDSFP
jgi:hypothetical protein